ncbi:phosphoenolpyruvate synthase [Mariprofundus ferrinatatus]|uniref:Phosphoenolpyruvate synthase n=1 Tax=Mariprofundus ferrinatatus TaxID=1921087 RepID=A0A2K8L5C6_9PROT|nr:phosphoenolpyruvate synthase [Mariprofundus ferrinatatus]ATX82312.1 phosphoenolpyruvate synthase [Mariprofundus ferrinatatus]
MKYIRFFEELGLSDVALVGGKNASLGEMYCKLTAKGIKIPNGFATTADAYWHYIEQNNLSDEIASTLEGLDTGNMKRLAECGQHLRSIIAHAKMPDDLEEEIIEAYRRLSKQYVEHPLAVSVRSSATAEDLPEASFAGQQESYLNVRGAAHVVEHVKRVYASLFTNRAISYRVDKGFDHMKVALSAGIQKMVRSDLASAGVMFSIDTETGFNDAVFITGSYGLGENVVQGTVRPDEAYVFKPLLKEGYRSLLGRTLGEKAQKMVYSESLKHPTKNVHVPLEEQRVYCLSEDELITLAKYAVAIEEHYSGLAGHLQPMDIEWAKDGVSGELFIVQARPETVHSQRDYQVLESYKLKELSAILAQGKSVGGKIAAGRARVIKDVSQIEEVEAGEVLVTDMTDPDWEPIMKSAAAIVTNRGGRTCHAAIISRELGLPAVVGTGNGTETITDGDMVTVSCAEGETGYVYEGELKFRCKTLNVGKLERPKTKIMMNVASPDRAFAFSAIPNDGVGLARLEFIINNSIGIHPNAILEFDKIIEARVKREIRSRASGYNSPVDFYVKKLAEGVATIAAAFYPAKVIFRMSDFKSNEYANLIGGEGFEPKEENPMIGFRGASRYYSDAFREAFALECRAMRLVREEKGLKNVCLMIPFTRTPTEGEKVLEVMEEHGLKRGEDGLEIYVMCEIPANVIAADAFLDIFDGFSIGSNDLTQLTLGVDRDSALVAHIFDEREPAILEMLKMAISACKRRNKYIGICGQAPSDYPEIAEFIVREGIESMSLNPDSVLETTLRILELEKELGR